MRARSTISIVREMARTPVAGSRHMKARRPSPRSITVGDDYLSALRALTYLMVQAENDDTMMAHRRAYVQHLEAAYSVLRKDAVESVGEDAVALLEDELEEIE